MVDTVSLSDYKRRKFSPSQAGDVNAILAQVQEIAREVVAPRSEEADENARWPAEGLRALQRAGLGGLVVQNEYGGKGQIGRAHV